MSLEAIIRDELHSLMLAIAKEHSTFINEVGLKNDGAVLVTSTGKRYVVSVEVVAAP